MRTSRLTSGAASIGLFALSAMAGQPRPVGGWDSISRLAPRSEVRIFLSGGRTLRGSLEVATSGSVTINVSKGQEVHLRQDVRRVQLRRPGHRLRNALIGFGIGAGAGLVAGAAADSAARPDVLLPHAGVLVLTPLGAIAGTVVGVALPSGGWRDVYRAP